MCRATIRGKPPCLAPNGEDIKDGEKLREGLQRRLNQSQAPMYHKEWTKSNKEILWKGNQLLEDWSGQIKVNQMKKVILNLMLL